MAKLNPAKELALIQGKLKNFSTKAKPLHYYDTGDEDLNNMLGHPRKGIPGGSLIEISGPPSCGKSVLALDLLGGAQDNGNYGLWLDAENSYNESWAATRGVDNETLALIKPYVGEFTTKSGKNKGKKEVRLITAEEQCAQAEKLIYRLNEFSKNSYHGFMVVDSITALLTREEAEGGIDGQNMRTKNALATFMSQLLRRWIGMATGASTTILFINQIRTNPNQLFGNPEYTTGGNAPKFYCHIRAKMHRSEGGKMMHSGRQIGIQGFMQNIKNKSGGMEYLKRGYQILFSGTTELMDVSKIKKPKTADA